MIATGMIIEVKGKLSSDQALDVLRFVQTFICPRATLKIMTTHIDLQLYEMNEEERGSVQLPKDAKTTDPG